MNLEIKLKKVKEMLLDIDKLVKEYNDSINPIHDKEIQNKINNKIEEINKNFGSLVLSDYYHHKERTKKLFDSFRDYCDIRNQILLNEYSCEYVLEDINLLLKDIEKSKNMNDNI